MKNIIEEIENEIPLECSYEEDARYNWPKRWKELKQRTGAGQHETIVMWRPVEEQTPNDFRVLVPIKNIHVAIAFFIDGKYWREYDVWQRKGVDEIKDVKHWLPLPKPPQAI